MQAGWREEPEAKGGCQCGALRYRIPAGPAKSVLCHCRMCQRASGNAFVPLLEVETARVEWQGRPAEWASSSLAWRGFCPTCGTPLYYRSGDTTEIMAGTLLPSFPFRPVANSASESRVPWLAGIGDLPDKPTPDWVAGSFASHQAPEEP